ncbi:MAG: hypothetical protein KatS3mg027_0540 [Bacteroidia bacterium]|nr:MAG: hypothetical protein KatS3mg027_0540 [Bacteroidia bacterium]
MKRIITILSTALTSITLSAYAQCIQTSQYPTTTQTINSTSPTTVTTCNFAGEYSVLNFTATGVYTINVTGGSGNYLTFTDNTNTPIVWGNSPLTVTVSTAGVYHCHISVDAACGTENSCRTTVVTPSVPPPSGCINTSQNPSSTVTIAGTGTTNVTNCNYAGEYAVLNFTATGQYSINATGGSGNFITFTDNTNNILASGNSPLVVNITSTGLYRYHLNTDAACGTDATCHNVDVIKSPCINTSQYPSNTTTISSTAPTTITTCNYAGEYSVNNFTATGVYTISSTGGSGNYITFTDASNNVILSGNSPLTVTISSTGVYNIHINTNASCGTESACHTVIVYNPGYVPPPTPSNDDCTNAIPITAPGTYTGTTIAATSETLSLPTCTTTGVSQPGVWYTITTPSAVTLMASLCNTSPNWDSKIFVYEGSCGSFTVVGCRDDNGPACSGTPASLAWCTQPGATYYILITGFSTASNFTLDITSSNSTFPVTFTASPSFSICTGSSATITASGATSYSWSTGAATSSIVVNPTVTTNYTLTAFNNLYIGCTNVSTVDVIVNPTPNVSVTSATICAGQTATLTASGATSYTWNTGATSSNITDNPTITTTYTVTGEDLGCTNTATAQVVVNPTPTASVSITDAVSPGCNNGSATVTISGGTAPYTYSWSAPATSSTNIATNLNGTSGSGTSYTVVVIDANGCSTSQTFTVDCVTSVAGISANTGISVYPNPNNGTFVITTNNTSLKTIRVMDITGRVILSTQSNEKDVEMNIVNYSRGIYVVEIESENGIHRINVVKE